MRKYTFSMLAIMLMLFACKKDNNNKINTSGKSSRVSFSIGFAQSTGIFNTAAIRSGKLKVNTTFSAPDSALQTAVDVIYINIYGADGNRVFAAKQLASDTSFGRVSVMLAPGNYTAAFTAGKTGLTLTGNGTFTNDNFTYGQAAQVQDTFFQKESIIVGEDGISQNIQLNRVVAKIIVNIEDAIPSNVQFIGMTFTDDPTSGQPIIFSTASGGPLNANGRTTIYTQPDVPVTTGVKNMKLCMYVFNADKPYSIRMFASNTLQPRLAAGLDGFPGNYSGDAIADVIVNNVAVQIGHQTTVTGRLFGGSGLPAGNGFNISVNPVWDSATNNISF